MGYIPTGQVKGTCHSIPDETREEAEAVASLINKDPLREAVVEEIILDVYAPKPVPAEPPPNMAGSMSPPTQWSGNICHKCGAGKVSELFKGEYCPRCNDWC